MPRPTIQGHDPERVWTVLARNAGGRIVLSAHRLRRDQADFQATAWDRRPDITAVDVVTR